MNKIVINPGLTDQITALRQQLHNCAELSGHEQRTMQTISDFLRTHSDFTVVQRDKYLYAYKKAADNLPNIAFRADMDAIPHGQEAVHGCGHDGHMAILAGLAVVLSNQPVQDKNIYLLFQHAEEIGTGAQEIVLDGFISEHHIKEIYGLHNIPNVSLGSVVSRENIFACTSKGLTIKLTGKPSHAAYPEYGINPAYAFAAIVNRLSEAMQLQYKGLVLYTIIHLQVGEKAFGTAAATGELSLTIRSEYEQDLKLLEEFICSLSVSCAQEHGLDCEFASCDYFPETKNHLECLHKLQQTCHSLQIAYETLEEPMRWSEDFGYYTKQTKGCFFGVGVGCSWPQLHTEQYKFNDEILPIGIKIFAALANMPVVNE